MSIYLDYAAATPLDPRVRLAMEPYLNDDFYNPSSPYLAARRVKADIGEARARVAHWLGARPTEVVFTAGATESINIAVHGVMRAFPGTNVVALSTEHDSVLRSIEQYDHAVGIRAKLVMTGKCRCF